MNREPRDEKLLIESLKTGDQDAFRELYERNAPKLKVLCVRLSIPKHESDDIIQETFKKIWEKRGTLNPELSFGSYVIQIAKHIVYNKIRHSLYVKKHERNAKPAVTLANIREMDIEKIVLEVVQKLPEKCRQIYKRSRIDGWSNKQIADEFKISRSTVENQINKALSQIRIALKKNGYTFNILFILYMTLLFVE